MPMPPPTLPRRNEKREGTAAGAVCSEEIRDAFPNVPKISIIDSRNLNEQLNAITVTLTNSAVDWSKRNNALKLIRSVCIAVKDTPLEAELVHRLNQMEEPLIASMKDLRSQVCKEAAISVCYLAVEYGTELLKVFEALLPCCIALVPNSAKVMATSGSQACDYIIEYVESPKLITTVVSSISSKSKEIRRQVQAMVLGMLTKWNTATFEKNIKSISEVVKAGINDADPGARQFARSSYQQLELNFSQVAQSLYKSLDPAKQKTLMGSVSAASSTQSISSLKDSTAMVRRPGALQSRQSAFFSGRSVSAIDPNSVRNLSRPKPMSTKRPQFIAPSPSRPSPSRPLSAKPSPARPSAAHGKSAAVDEKKLFADIANLSLASDEEDFLSGGTEYELQKAIKYCGSADITDKRKGLKILYDTFKAQKSINNSDCKKVNDILIKLLNEGNHKIITPLCETMVEFLACYNRQTIEYMSFLLNRVLCKRSSELLPNSQASLDSVIKTIRTSYSADHQLYTLCNIIGGNHFSIQPTKAKEAIIHYLLDLFPLLTHNTELNRADVKAAISRLFQLKEDSKYTNMHATCDELVAQFFNLNTPDFSTILATLPSNWKEYAYQMLNRKNEYSFATSSPAVTHHSSPAPVYAAASAPPPNSKFLLGSISMRDSSSTSPSSVEHYKNSSNTSISSEPSILINETIHLGQNPGEQKDFLNNRMATLSNMKSCSDLEEVEQCDALKSITQMVSEGSFTLWDSFFNLLLLKVFDGLENPRLPIKTQTLKLLNKLCFAQASRFYDRAQAIILKVLGCSQGVKSENNLWFFQALQDCLHTLATHLPASTVLSVVNGIINEQNDERRCSALKMITTLVKNLDITHLEELLPDIAPGIVRAYSSEHSNERKSAIFALVEMVGRLGQPVMEPYLEELGKGRKILDVYLKRNQSGSQNF